MKRCATAAVIGFVAAFISCLPLVNVAAQTDATVRLTRLDCGNEPKPVSVASFSDTYTFPDFKLQLTYSCYLIRHGNEYMLWDTGLAVGSAPESPKTSLVELLGRLKVTAEQVKYVGISHYHYDHIGQASSFPRSTLLIGKGDWDVISTSGLPPAGMTAQELVSTRAAFVPWTTQGGKVETVTGDRKDVFGDGTVVILSMPGHTPGHTSLLVRLSKTGDVLLSGDVTHFRENYESNGVPTWNFHRADSLASLDRFRQIAKGVRATVIIQHDPRDVSKLPTFPTAAE